MCGHLEFHSITLLYWLKRKNIYSKNEIVLLKKYIKHEKVKNLKEQRKIAHLIVSNEKF